MPLQPQSVELAAASPAADAWEWVPCPMGCLRDDQEVLRGSDRLLGLGGAFTVVRCRGCQLQRTNPRPSREAIADFYPTRYGPYRLPGANERRPGRFAALLRALRWDGTRDLVPPGVSGRALEIGCASGAFLLKLRRRGLTATGLEPSPTAARAARELGFPVFCGGAEDLPAKAGPFDLIVASHALEHIHDPVKALSLLRKSAASGAWLTCAVPDAGSFVARTFGPAWYDLDLPRHLTHFTATTLTRVLRRTGWKTVRVRGQASLNPWAGSVGRVLIDRAARRGRTSFWGTRCESFPERSLVLKPALEPLALLLAALRQSGRMVVWARAD